MSHHYKIHNLLIKEYNFWVQCQLDGLKRAAQWGAAVIRQSGNKRRIAIGARTPCIFNTPEPPCPLNPLQPRHHRPSHVALLPQLFLLVRRKNLRCILCSAAWHGVNFVMENCNDLTCERAMGNRMMWVGKVGW